MNPQLTALGELGQGQFVRLTLDNGTEIEGRATQTGVPDGERLRAELSTERSESYDRYQVRTRFIDGAWTPVTVRGHRSGDDDWAELGAVANITPLEQYQTITSDGMEAQRRTGSDA